MKHYQKREWTQPGTLHYKMEKALAAEPIRWCGGYTGMETKPLFTGQLKKDLEALGRAIETQLGPNSQYWTQKAKAEKEKKHEARNRGGMPDGPSLGNHAGRRRVG